MDQRHLAKRSSVASERPYGGPATDSYYQAYGGSALRYESALRHSANPAEETVSSDYGSHYDSRHPVYGLDWTGSADGKARIVLSSCREDSTNRVRVIEGTENGSGGLDFREAADARVQYPATRVQWDPADSRRFAATAECLRIYEQNDDDNVLCEKMCLTNAKTKNLYQLPPMTSFDWNRTDPTLLLTCSIDTTCTLWDIGRTSGATKTQLIAHDNEVYDVKFVSGSKHVFTSCSNDGSVRVFDLRNLEHSTIIYEPQGGGLQPKNPLVRLAASNYNANHIAVLEENSSRILLLDLRYPGAPLRILREHTAPVNAIAWHPHKNLLVTAADDCQTLLFDMSLLDSERPFSHGGQHRTVGSIQPAAAFHADTEINNVCWAPTGSWVACNYGRRTQAIHT